MRDSEREEASAIEEEAVGVLVEYKNVKLETPRIVSQFLEIVSQLKICFFRLQSLMNNSYLMAIVGLASGLGR